MSATFSSVACRRTFALSITALLSIGGAALIYAQDEAPKAETEPSKLQDDLIGAWTVAESPVGQEVTDGRFLKFFGRKHWATSHSDEDGGVTYYHGGTYTLDGDTYEETVEFATGQSTQLVGQKFKFKIKVEGDTYTQTGIGNPYNEVWNRGK
jgi:hypothetical protein